MCSIKIENTIAPPVLPIGKASVLWTSREVHNKKNKDLQTFQMIYNDSNPKPTTGFFYGKATCILQMWQLIIITWGIVIVFMMIA